ncbi:MAG: DUF4360 domain-containing protein [Oligoflexia bacterium]|nr:DUF4360 domain-containing protein [Oligoflexia bacterium]
MEMKKLLGLLLALLSLSAIAAAPDIRLGMPGYAGTGCPAGSASVTLSPDRTALSILFDQYVAEAGGVTGRSFDRKTCNVSIPVLVPNGFSVSIFKIDYRGYVNVPVGGQANFNVEYFFAGAQGPRYQKTFPGGFDNQYFLTNTLPAAAVVWSPCGQSVNLRVNTAMLAKSNTAFEDAMATVDSIDIRSGLIYHIQWRVCR